MHNRSDEMMYMMIMYVLHLCTMHAFKRNTPACSTDLGVTWRRKGKVAFLLKISFEDLNS